MMFVIFLLQATVLGYLTTSIKSADQCGGAVVLDPTGGSYFLQSPNYPQPYPNNVACDWTIDGPEGYGLLITAESFALEPQSSCGYDSLTVTDLIGNDRIFLGIFCGTSGPNRVHSISSKVLIQFRSDEVTAQTGFRIRIEKQECKTAELCPNAGVDKDVCFKLCDDKKECPKGQDEYCSRRCGIPAKKPLLSTKSGRIVGGIEAKAHSWPWQVALLTETGVQNCGGSIIDHHWILSAAHCCEPYNPEATVRVGVHNLSGSLEANALTYKIQKFIPHPLYDANSPVTHHDICLLKTYTPILFSEDVSPVCLGSEVLPPVGTDCYVTGFGNVAVNGASSNILRQVDVKITDHHVCNKAYEGDISADMICAANPGKDACQRDSGGPLVCPSQTDPSSFELVGVTSWGQGCALPEYPGVYAKTAYFFDWIAETIAKE